MSSTFQDMAGEYNASSLSFLNEIPCHTLPSLLFFVFEKQHYGFFETACMLCYVMLLIENSISQCFFTTLLQDMTYKMYVISSKTPDSLLMTYKHNIQTYKFGG